MILQILFNGFILFLITSLWVYVVQTLHNTSKSDENEFSEEETVESVSAETKVLHYYLMKELLLTRRCETCSSDSESELNKDFEIIN